MLIVNGVLSAGALSFALYAFVTGITYITREYSPKMQAAFIAKRGYGLRPGAYLTSGAMRIGVAVILVVGTVVSDSIWFFGPH